MKNRKKEVGIQVISRAASILRILDCSNQSLGAIANATGLPRSTVQRIVASLASEKFVEADKQGVRIGCFFNQKISEN
ncbi:helix-turn-helix domain-containing protein [Pectobacterium carotovorum]